MSHVSLKKIGFRYDETRVLGDISFEVQKGEFFGIIGPNGSGKTTLLRIIDKILVPCEGSVKIGETDLYKIKRNDLAKIVGVVSQDFPPLFPFTAHEIVMMGRSPHLGKLKFEGKGDLDIVKRAMEMTDIFPLAGRPFGELSGGEMQRVLIARALAQRPEIILLDESTAHLDIKHQIDFLNLMRNLNREEGLTVIAVTHDINLSSLYCDRILLLSRGTVHSMGTPGEVIRESSIEEVYETKVLVDKNPKNGVPRVTLLASESRDYSRF
ncbi:MAG: ABC transporter ATP-binding protein [Deltaproteobacteria bacterium]|nr:ABC transporter ATP-binding protein [Deltaproteobacteria bacterium]MBN2844671.1 ABC transporter ATP-binding protein [Deltaproteobacteria bacterium]